MRFYSILLLCFFTVASTKKVTYDNYKVHSILVRDEHDVKTLNQLKEESKFDFWTENVEIGGDVKLIVSPEQNEEFERINTNNSLQSRVIIPNVERLIAAQRIPAKVTKSAVGNFSFSEYHPVETIHNWLDELAKLYPNTVNTFDIGTTYEGRTIKGLKIDLKPNDRGSQPLAAIVECGIHAREWISPATCAGIINEFLMTTDPEIKRLAETFVWHIIPVLNVDGYAYTFSTERMWRKNRNPILSENCPNGNFGVDLNRNFNFVWMSVGASDDPCTNTYAGPTAASELETRAISNYILQVKETSNLIYYWAFHSFSQLVIVPHSHVVGEEKLQASNFGDMFEIGVKGADKLASKYNTQYRIGVSADVMYKMSGTSFDWAKGVADVPISILVELRDLGLYGFLLPPDQIVPNNEEILDFLVEADRVARQLKYYYSSSNGVVGSAVLILSSLLYLMI